MAILTVNDDVVIPGVVVCLHVETILKPKASHPDTYTHELRCWAAVAGRIEDDKWTREKSSSSLLGHSFFSWVNYVRIVHRPVWVFAQNLPIALTALGLWQLLESGEFSLHRRPTAQTVQYRRRHGKKDPEKALAGLLITSSPPDAVICYHKTGWKLIILGLENYWANSTAISVNDCACTTDSVPTENAPLANWLAYSTARASAVSCKVTKLLCWHRKQELGRFGFSTAGIALAGFRHRFMDTRIYCPNDQDDRDREREGYYPGRVEAFWQGTLDERGYTPLGARESQARLDFDRPGLPIYQLDSRSFYGAVGATENLPCEHVESSPDSGDCRPPDSGRIVEYLAGVEIATCDDVYPVRHHGRVLYARGHFRTVLAGPELSRAYQRGHVKRWLWWRRYRLEPILHTYSLAMWNERLNLQKKGEPDLERICKTLLAVLHGKFLQRRNKWQARPDMCAPEAWAQWSEGSASTGVFHKFRAIGFDVEEEVDTGDTDHCFPAIAAWVTSWGREWLNHWMNVAGAREVLYVATDSLIVTETGRSNLERYGIIWPDGIGSLRITDRLERVSITGANNAEFGPRRVRSGRRKADQETGPDDGISLVTDSLAVILHSRAGQHVCARAQPWTDRPARLIQEVLPGGWLKPPEVYTCSDSFRSTSGQLPSSAAAAT